MRKIYLKENSLESLVKGRLLPQFLFKKVKEQENGHLNSKKISLKKVEPMTIMVKPLKDSI